MISGIVWVWLPSIIRASFCCPAVLLGFRFGGKLNRTFIYPDYRRRMVGHTISHYRILEKLGEGGMGVVYKAEDLKLKRTVALKFLPETVSRDPHSLERFQREAHAASSLNHPHICTIYDIDEADGKPFIAMELLEGQPLRERIAGKPLKLHEVLDLGIQIA